MTARLAPPECLVTRDSAASGRRRVSSRRTASHTTAIAWRNLKQFRNDPAQLPDATLIPMILTVVLVYVFGGAIGPSTASYRQFLIPGIMVQSVGLAAQVTGMTLNLDFSRGIMDRFRAMPIARSAVLSGRIIADLARMAISQVVVLAFASSIGFRLHSNVAAVLAAIGMLLLYRMALSWISALVGLRIKSPQTVQSMGFLWMISLQFGSSMFAPVNTTPGWLQAFAKVNPNALVIDAARSLLAGGGTAVDLVGALSWILGLARVFAPPAVWRFAQRT